MCVCACGCVRECIVVCVCVYACVIKKCIYFLLMYVIGLHGILQNLPKEYTSTVFVFGLFFLFFFPHCAPGSRYGTFYFIFIFTLFCFVLSLMLYVNVTQFCSPHAPGTAHVPVLCVSVSLHQAVTYRERKKTLLLLVLNV